MAKLLVSLLLASTICVYSSGTYSCPAYTDIAQPSVAGESFTIDEFEGRWYMVGTNEPTMPSICKCPYNDVQVNTTAGEYSYVNNFQFLNYTGSIGIKGKLSDDPIWPGELHENAAILHGLLGLDPNFIFHVKRDTEADGNPIKYLMTYACLGKFPPIFGSDAFSFNLLARSKNNTQAELLDLVQEANKLTNGVLDISAIRYTDKDAYDVCATGS